MNCLDFIAGRCRSCSEIQTPYALQLAEKSRRAALALPAGITWLAPEASRIAHFRNKAKMVAGYASASGPLVLGILRGDGMVQELVQCPLYEPQIHQAWLAILAFPCFSR